MYQRFLRGRYGIDSTSLVLILIAYILLNFRGIWAVSYILLGIFIFRTLSKNVAMREKEHQFFVKFFRNINKKINFHINKYKDRKKYVYFKCQKCNNNLRLPKNKGRLQGKCPVCGIEFIMRT